MEQRNKRITVGKTKVAKAPWEEDRYIYDIKTRNNSVWSGNVFIFIIQIIVGAITFIWAYNNI